MDHLVLPLLLALSGLAQATPEPQKFPEDFYSGSDATDVELPLPPDKVSPSSSFNNDFETSPVHSPSALQSKVDLRLMYHSIMNTVHPTHSTKQ